MRSPTCLFPFSSHEATDCCCCCYTLYTVCTAIRPFSFFFPYLLYWEKERKHDGLLFVYTSAIRVCVCVCCLGLLLFCFFFVFLPLSDLKVNSPRMYVVSREAGKNRKEQVKASPKTRAQAIFSSADELYTHLLLLFSCTTPFSES